IGLVDPVERGLCAEHVADTDLDRLAHGVLGVELRLLREVADLDVLGRARLAGAVLVDAGHDLQHGRLAGAVEAEQADLGGWEERQRDVLDDLALRRHRLGHAVHGVDVLRHGDSVDAALWPGGEGDARRTAATCGWAGAGGGSGIAHYRGCAGRVPCWLGAGSRAGRGFAGFGRGDGMAGGCSSPRSGLPALTRGRRPSMACFPQPPATPPRRGVGLEPWEKIPRPRWGVTIRRGLPPL